MLAYGHSGRIRNATGFNGHAIDGGSTVEIVSSACPRSSSIEQQTQPFQPSFRRGNREILIDVDRTKIVDQNADASPWSPAAIDSASRLSAPKYPEAP